MLSLFSASKSVIKSFDRLRKMMLWQSGLNTTKYHLVDWDLVCQAKDQGGGLGLLDLICMNISLLVKWLWRLESSESLWQQIVKGKYLKNLPSVLVKKKPNDPWFWKGLMDVKERFLRFSKKIIGNGENTSFCMMFGVEIYPFRISLRGYVSYPLIKIFQSKKLFKMIRLT